MVGTECGEVPTCKMLGKVLTIAQLIMQLTSSGKTVCTFAAVELELLNSIKGC